MESTKCRACRSVNHATSIRCINCGAPLHEDATPSRPDAPVGSPSVGSWTSLVPPTPKRQRSPSGVILKMFAVVVALGTVAIVVMAVSRGFDPQDLNAAFWLLNLLIFAFWVGMLVDAIMGSKIGWVLAIVFLGILGALLYVFLGRDRREQQIA